MLIPRIFAICFALFVCSSFPVTGASAEGPTISLKQALALAKETRKPILVDFYADWCAPCVELNTKTFSDAKVKERLSHFIVVRLDMGSDDKEAPRAAFTYNIVGLPALIFLTPDGKEIDDTRIHGFLPPEEFIKIVDLILNRGTAQTNAA